jgi:group I intron endonuclease
MEKKFNFVYITTNLINGKQYIGDHSTNNLVDNYTGSGKLINRAIKKYGKKNFKTEILEQLDTKEEAFNLQEKYITEYNTLQPNGYNISPMGGSKYQGSCSKQTRKILSRSHTGKKHTKEARNKISEALRQRKRKPETSKKNSDKQKGVSKLFYFIKKYGEKLGLIKYKEYIKKIKDRLSGKSTSRKGKKLKQEFIEKYGEKEGTKKYEEFIKKQRESHLGKNKGKTYEEMHGIEKAKELKINMSICRKGKKLGPQSKEVIEKRANSNRGKKRSDETKRNISNSLKGKRTGFDTWNKNKTRLNITPIIIKEIKVLHKEGKYQREIAKIYNFSNSCVARIIKGFYDNKQQISRGK